MRVTTENRRCAGMKPLHRAELLPIEFECKATIRPDHIPERNIGMARSDTHSLGTSQEQWRSWSIAKVQSQLLSQLPRHCDSRMLPGLNVPTAWQPKLCIPMVHEQHVVAIHQHEVRHEMLRRCGRFLNSAQLHTGVDPRKRIFTLRALERIERHYGCNFVTYGAAHTFHWL